MSNTDETIHKAQPSWKELLALILGILSFLAGYSISGVQFLYQFSWFLVFLLALTIEVAQSHRETKSKQLLLRAILLLLTTILVSSFFSAMIALSYTGDPFSLLYYVSFLLLASFLVIATYRKIGEKVDWNTLKFLATLYAITAVSASVLTKSIVIFVGLFAIALVFYLLGCYKQTGSFHGMAEEIKKDFSARKIHLTLVFVVSLLFLFYFMGKTLFVTVSCNTNVQTWENDANIVLLYGPQELLVLTKDGNAIIVKPWKPIIMRKSILCDANLKILTSLGIADCSKLEVCTNQETYIASDKKNHTQYREENKEHSTK